MANGEDASEVHSQGTKRRLTPQQMELEKLQHEARQGMQKQQAERSIRAKPVEAVVAVKAVNEAALAARDQGKSREMHEALLERAASNNTDVAELAAALNLDLGRFRAAMDRRIFREAVMADIDEARALGVRTTPTVFIAGRKLEGVELEFFNDTREQLTDTVTRINALEEAAAGLSDRVRQTSLVSPVTGTIKQLFYNTVGGVVLPGRDIVELVPADDSLLVEVRVRPQDIAFMAPGQKANVKVTAYDFVVYGGLEGKVEQIGVDTVVDEEGNAYYEVAVRTTTVNFGEDKPIIPGMTVEVDILTGKKTVLAYLMKPVLRAHQRSLSER